MRSTQLSLLAELLLDVTGPAVRPAPASPKAPAPLHERFTIEASQGGLSIIAPAQQVATAPFQPVAERTSLPGLFLRYRWVDLAPLFAAYDACEPLPEHPAAPWIERIIAAVKGTETLLLAVSTRHGSWISLSCRSVWTGLDRADLLRQAERPHCDTRAQGLARADAVGARLRAAGRLVVIRDLTADARVEIEAADEPRLNIAPGTLRLGALVITVGAGASAP